MSLSAVRAGELTMAEGMPGATPVDLFPVLKSGHFVVIFTA